MALLRTINASDCAIVRSIHYHFGCSLGESTTLVTTASAATDLRQTNTNLGTWRRGKKTIQKSVHCRRHRAQRRIAQKNPLARKPFHRPLLSSLSVSWHCCSLSFRRCAARIRLIARIQPARPMIGMVGCSVAFHIHRHSVLQRDIFNVISASGRTERHGTARRSRVHLESDYNEFGETERKSIDRVFRANNERNYIETVSFRSSFFFVFSACTLSESCSIVCVRLAAAQWCRSFAPPFLDDV